MIENKQNGGSWYEKYNVLFNKRGHW
jgi:hypothetical protein